MEHPYLGQGEEAGKLKVEQAMTWLIGK